MKFDFCIGNPPYQGEAPGESTSEKPIYHEFLSAAYNIADKVEMITPARFLFNAGATPSKWNKQMLNDEHLKVLNYEPNSTSIFPSTDIKGGVVITYRDIKRNYGAISSFTPFEELRTICDKVVNRDDFSSFDAIVSGRTPYMFTDEIHNDYPNIKYHTDESGNNLGVLSKGHDYDISSNAFDALPEIFPETCDNIELYYNIIGRYKNLRVNRYIKKKYVRGRKASYCLKYKVFLPKANGSGAIGEVFSTPLIGTPLDVATDTFLVIGELDTKQEAYALLKYIKSKFARVLLSRLKVTQLNSKDTWRYVPLQDFTENSDIDWSQSIPDIDKQLYAKYGLSQEEIDFIETHVKEME